MTGLLEQESKQGQKESGQQKTEKKTPKNKKNQWTKQKVCFTYETLLKQASDGKEWECHIYPTVL